MVGLESRGSNVETCHGTSGSNVETCHGTSGSQGREFLINE
ncbi:hypothetical protein MC7420_5036 [Coleofasciculus chthonoplastes PCC 7420]|uniref:Uncharacterized protein n=1 Tax=Coleofasciculus chthonoplastes PCC 7420 TaxID=118168 RepID=B4W1J3_9CYAN|nr:hypothetical protein MC7420_5036 [Coleofasciculus chthonoplastes PCC 7420]